MDEGVVSQLDVAQLAIGMVGGLALFLFGLTQLTDALQTAAGDRLRKLLGKFTSNRFMGVGTGAITTAVLQSSSITTVLLVGFSSAGLMSLPQSISVIMGANIGSTVTAQIIAFDVKKYALLVITAGFMLTLLSRQKQWKRYGSALLGLGLVFYGMSVMSDAALPLRTYAPFLEFMTHLESPWLGVGFGLVFTALVQSSAATTGLLIIFAGQGLVTLEAGIAVALGANIGTCVTALLATIGQPREALRVAVVHVLFNIAGVMVWIWLIGQLADLVRSISPTFTDLEGAERIGAETPRQIANAHTIFNVINTLVMIWFVGPFGALVERLIPLRAAVEPPTIVPKHIDDYYLSAPSEALDRLMREIVRMGKRVVILLEQASPAVVAGSKEELERIASNNEAALLARKILKYIRKLSREDLSATQSARLQDLMTITNYLSSTDELIRTNLVGAGLERVQRNVKFSKETIHVIRPLYDIVARSMAWSLRALIDDEADLARRIMAMKPEVLRLAQVATEHLSQRLLVDEPHRVTVFRLESEIVGQIKRLYYFSKRIARTVAASLKDANSEPEGDVNGAEDTSADSMVGLIDNGQP